MDIEREIKVRDAIKYCIENFDSQTATNRIVEFWKDELRLQQQQCNIANVVKSLPNYDEIEDAANKNADRIFGDDIGSNTEWYAMHNGFTDGVEWLKNHLTK